MGKVKKKFLIFIITLFMYNSALAQQGSAQKVILPILEIDNKQFEKLLKDIVAYETNHCSIKIDRGYFIKREIIDSTTSMISISSIEIEDVLNISYGVFFFELHTFLVKVPINDFLSETSYNTEFLIKDKNVENLFIFDDSQTIWKFLFINGRFQFENFEGICDDYYNRNLNPLEKREHIEIELIEEMVDDFPN